MTAPPYIKYLARYQPSTLIDIIINISQNMLLIPRPRTDHAQARVLGGTTGWLFVTLRCDRPAVGCWEVMRPTPPI